MKIEYTEKASEQLAKLPAIAQERIKNKLEFYARQKDPLSFAKRLSGVHEYRFRVGEYRIIFAIDSKAIYIILIVRRDKAYRDL